MRWDGERGMVLYLDFARFRPLTVALVGGQEGIAHYLIFDRC